MASGKRPEHAGPPDLFYNDTEARKYTQNSHMIEIQASMSERALELLALPDDETCLLLDAGCGSGLSGDVLDDAGHVWVGLDISGDMLNVALEREATGDLILSDMGQGLMFRPGSFDGVISISALQWLCNADTKAQHPPKRLYRFFSALFAALKRGARAVFQFYPETSAQLDLITQQAMKAGFRGGLVVDFPNSVKAKKIFLVLFTSGVQQLPTGLTEESTKANEVRCEARQRGGQSVRDSMKARYKSKTWIKQRKERATRQGREVRPDSKYTGRKRKHKF